MGFFGSEVTTPSGQVLFFVQVVVAIFLAAHILIRKQDPQVCMGWLLAVALFPLLTLFFYMSVGVNPFAKYASRKRKSQILAGIKRPRLSHHELIKANDDLMAEYGYKHFDRTLDWVSHVTGQPAQAGNSVEMLVNSDTVYAEMHRAIEDAQSFVLVQFYQIQADTVGFAFLDLLARKANDGVTVHVLFDALGSFTLKTEDLERYRTKGLHMRRFLEIHPIKGRFQINWRNHRKLVVVDGETAFVGGFNIGQLYLQGPNPEKPTWVDLLFRVRGPVLNDFMGQFLEDWHFTTGRVLTHVVASVGQKHKEQESQSLLLPVRSGPSDSNAPFYSTFQHILYEARSRVWIMTPYFVPDKSLMHAMRVAVARGVHVRVIVPLRSNHRFTDLCASSYFAEFSEYGIDVLRYPFGVCHGKILLADDDLVFSGSSNMDYRSFFLNFETDLFIRDRDLSAKIDVFMRHIGSLSIGIHRRDVSGIRFGRLLLRRIMRLFAPLM